MSKTGIFKNNKLKGKALFFLATFLLALISVTCQAAFAQPQAGNPDKRQIGRTEWTESGNVLQATISGEKAGIAKTAGTSSLSYSISFESPTFEKVGKYDRINLPPCDPWLGTPGTPAVPSKPVKLLIPQGKDAVQVNVTAGPLIQVEGQYLLEPTQKQFPIGLVDRAEPTLPDPDIYSLDEVFPLYICGDAFLQEKHKCKFLIVNLYPLKYYPKSGKIAYHANMTIEVVYRERLQALTAKRGIKPGIASLNTKRLREVRSIVDNPQVLNTFIEARTGFKAQAITSAPLTPPYNYVIITTQEFADANVEDPDIPGDTSGDYSFQDLIDSKLSKGLTATIVTTEYIYANYTGVDEQAKIRNFIIDYYENRGLEYVLLGGDKEHVPARHFWVPRAYDVVDSPADMYYGCLDGTFDGDGDGIYGEPTDGPGDPDQPNPDEVDFFGEVYVGRACVDNADDISNFVRKTLAYEYSGGAYLSNVYMTGELLWDSSRTYGAPSMEEIRLGTDMYGYTTVGFENSLHADFFDTHTLYDIDAPWGRANLLNIINPGVHILNHLGHSWADMNMRLYISNLSSLANTDYYFAYSQGCMPGAFDNPVRLYRRYVDYDCIAEQMVNLEHGAFAYVANARFGWGSHNPDPTNGVSQHYNREFWDALFGEEINSLGKMNQDSKEDNAHRITGDNLFRFVCFELNLFGDPEVQIKASGDFGFRLRVTIEPREGGSVALHPAGPWHEPDSEVSLNADANEGYYFSHWSVDLTGSDNPTTITMDSDKSVTAHFTQFRYDLTVNKGSGSGTYPHGSAVDIVADPPPSKGYRFSDWTGDTQGIADVYRSRTKITMLGHSEITANYRVGTYFLTVDSEKGQVVVDPYKSAGYDYGDTVELTPIPDDGFLFLKWSGDVPSGHEADNPLSIVIDDDKSITAHFGVAYTITIIAENGDVEKTPNQATYLEGTVVTLDAKASIGHHFDRWSGDLRGNKNPERITVDEDKNVTAHFDINTYTLDIRTQTADGAVGPGTIAKDPDLDEYPHGTEVSLEALPSPPYFHVSWSGDLSGDENPATITVDSAKSVTAIYDIFYAHISSIDPAIKPYSSYYNAEMEITGEYFGNYFAGSQCSVEFTNEEDTFNAEIVTWTNEHIKCIIPILPPGDYEVRAVNRGGPSNGHAFRVYQVIPQAPSDLEAIAVTQNTAKLKWRDNSTNEEGFIIERARNGWSFEVIANVGPDTEYFLDTSLIPSAEYRYRVKAYNWIGHSAYSNRSVITVYEQNEPPQVYLVNHYYAFVGVPFELRVYARDRDDPLTPEGQLSYAASNLPPGATFDAATGTLSWLPTEGDKGFYEAMFTVSDSDYTINKNIKIYTCTEELETVEIRSNTDYDQHHPAIYDDKIVWHERLSDDSGAARIHIHDLSKGTERQIPFDGDSQYYPAIYGEKIACYETTQTGSYRLAMYDLEEENATVLAGRVHDATKPAIHEDRVVWVDATWTYPEIHMYDLFTGEGRAITSWSNWDLGRKDPAIYRDRVVWHEAGSGRRRMYLYDIASDEETELYTTHLDSHLTPDVFEDTITWEYRRSSPTYGVYMYDIPGESGVYLDTDVGQDCDPVIYGDKITWKKDVSGTPHIYMHSIYKDEGITIAEDGLYPDIYQNKIVWQKDISAEDSGIFMANFISCPEIYTISSTQLEPGKIITLTGRNFGFNQGSSQIVFPSGEKATEILGWRDTYITCRVPDLVASGDLVVVNAGGESNPIAVTAPNLSPENGVVIPDEGERTYDKWIEFITSYKDPNAWNNLEWVSLELQNDEKFFKLLYRVQDNTLFIWDEDAQGGQGDWIGGFASGSGEVIHYKYGMLGCTYTRGSGHKDTLHVYWHIKFYESFIGEYGTYLSARDIEGLTAEPEKKGTYTIWENLPPSVGNIIPSIGSEMPAVKVTFETAFSDPDGWQDLEWSLFHIKHPGEDGRFVSLRYGFYTGLCVYDEDAGEWIGGIDPGTDDVIDYKYCRLDCKNTTVSNAGNDENDLDITWAVTFKGDFEGLADTYLQAQDSVGNTTELTKRGIWRIGARPRYELDVIKGSGDGTYPEWTVANIKADDPVTGYHFLSWGRDVENVADVKNPETTIEMLDDATVGALYEPNDYTLTVNRGVGSGVYLYRTIVDIKAILPIGYHFSHWSGDTEHIADVNAPVTTIEIFGDAEISANLEVDRYELAVVRHDITDDWTGESFKGNGDGRFNRGERIELGVELANVGERDVSALACELRLAGTDPYITVDDNFKSVSFPAIALGERAASTGRFVVEASEDTPENYNARFELYINEIEGEYANTEELELTVLGPVPIEGAIGSLDKDVGGAMCKIGAFDEDYHAVTSDENGNIYAVWSDYRYEKPDIYFTRSIDYGLTWSEAVKINTNPTGTFDSIDPQISCDNEGHVYVTWLDMRSWPNEGIYFNYSDDYGLSWQEEDIRIDEGLPTDGAVFTLVPRMCSDENNNVYVTWNRRFFSMSLTAWSVYFSRSTDNGATWQQPIKLNTDSDETAIRENPEISCDENNNVYVVWQDKRLDQRDLYFNCSNQAGSAGSWQTEDIKINNHEALSAKIECDNSGNVYVLWFGYSDRNIYLDYSDGSGSAESWQADDIKVNTTTNPEWNKYDFSCDNHGNVYAVWEAWISGKPHVCLNRSDTNGQTWQTEDIIINTLPDIVPNSYDVSPAVSSDDNGNVFVAWVDFRNFVRTDIFFDYSQDGGTTWQDEDIRLTTIDPALATNPKNPFISSDNKGNLYAIWWEARYIPGSGEPEGSIFFNYANFGFSVQEDIVDGTVDESSELLIDVTAKDPNKKLLEITHDSRALSDEQQENMENATWTISPAVNAEGETEATFAWTPLPPSSDGVYDPVYILSRNHDTRKCAFQDIAITVNDTPVDNSPPKAEDDSYSVNEDATLDAGDPDAPMTGVLLNDTDPDDDALTAELVQGESVTNGSLTFNENGSFTYTPSTNFNGGDSFTYKAFDGEFYSLPATVTITVIPVNDAPIAVDDTAATNEDTFVVIDVLDNDSDIDGDSLTISHVSDPLEGTTKIENEKITYTPDINENGTHTFTYKAFDGEFYSLPATVTITVIPVNDAPVADDDSYTTDEDTILNVDAANGILNGDTDVDGDTLTAILVGDVPDGHSLSLDSNGSFTYTPKTDFVGAVSFTYKANDGALDSNDATVTVTVDPVNDAPIAYDNDAYSTDEEITLNVNETNGVIQKVNANGEKDFDIDGDQLTAVLETGPANGALTLYTDGSFTYEPNANFNGEDSFTYRASDGSLQSDEAATVTITVDPVNDTPIAVDDHVDAKLGIPITIYVLENDISPDGKQLSILSDSVTDPPYGHVEINLDIDQRYTSITYTADSGYVGSDSFTYRITDGTLQSDYATVYITVTTPDDPVFVRYRIVDDWTGESYRGNGDGKLNPGERIELEVYLKNTGEEAAEGVEATLYTTDSYITIIDDVAGLPDIPAGEIRSTDGNNFVIEAADDIPQNRHTATFAIRITTADGFDETEEFAITAVKPLDVSGGYLTEDINLNTEDSIPTVDGGVVHAVCSDRNGNVYSVWEDSRNGETDIYFNHSGDYGATWQDEATIINNDSPGLNPSRNPVISCTDDGHVYVAWVDNRSHSLFDVHFNYSEDYGRTWQAEDKEFYTVGDTLSNYPRIASDNNGNVYIVWEEVRLDKDIIRFNYSHNYGDYTTWQILDMRLDTEVTGIFGSYRPVISCDEGGNVYVAWTVHNYDTQDPNDVYFKYSNNGGVDWYPQDHDIQLNVNSTQGHSEFPQISSDANGYVYVVWRELIGGGVDIRFNYSSDYGGSWQGDVSITTEPPYSASTKPIISSDDNGHVYVAWEDYRNTSPDIYFNFSDNHGANWQLEDKMINDIQYSIYDQTQPVIGSDNLGNVYIAWKDTRNFIRSDIFFDYSANYGDYNSWQEDIRVTTVDDTWGSSVNYPGISSDEKGNVFVAWWDTRNDIDNERGNIYFNSVTLGFSNIGEIVDTSIVEISDKTVEEGSELAFDVISFDPNKKQVDIFYDNRGVDEGIRDNMGAHDDNWNGHIFDPVAGATSRRFSWTPGDSAAGTYEPVYYVSRNDETRKCDFAGIAIDVSDITRYTLTVTIVPDGIGNDVDPDSGQYDAGSVLTLTPTPVLGYGFYEWSGSGVPSGHEEDNPLSITMDSDKSITANFVMYGDVSGDGNLNGYDALLAAEGSLGQTTLTDRQFFAADVDGSGDITGYDVLKIVEYALEIIDRWPVEQ